MRNKCFEWHFIDIQCDAVKWRSVSIDVRLIERKDRWYFHNDKMFIKENNILFTD